MAQQSLLHLNTSVYEVVEDKDGNTSSLMKQVNNPIPVTQVVVQRKVDVTYNELKKAYYDLVATCGSKDVKEHKTFWLYPLKDTQLDDKMNFTVIHGVMMEQRRRDPDALIQIPVDATQAEETAAKMNALKPYTVAVGFMLAVPETDKFMFDVSLSHIPMTAVAPYEPGKQLSPEEEEQQLPLGVDPSQQFVSGEDMDKLRKFRMALDAQVAEALNGGDKLPEGFSIDEARAMADAEIASREEYERLRSFFVYDAASSDPDLSQPQ